jgi:succinate dehydrogenase / fumarate reductase iron-sulfur subunit
MNYTLHIWRQNEHHTPPRFVTYQVSDISADMSFLEMLDELNEQLISIGDDPPVAFDLDCREGICGACGMVINGVPHGGAGSTTCELYMRHFQDGAEISVEPFRAEAFPVIRDLVVDRRALDHILQAGGYISVNTGSAPDANALLVAKSQADTAFQAANCIGCGACVAACGNASAMLFLAAKVTHLGLLPQGQPERTRRVIQMVEEMDKSGFGNCTNQYECAAVCPKQIPVDFIARLNREFLTAALTSKEFTEAAPLVAHEE